MKIRHLTVVLGLLGAAIPAAPTPSQVSGERPSGSSSQTRLVSLPRELPAGLILEAKNWNSFSSDNARAGRKVKAQITEDAIADGHVIIPRKAMLIGHLAEAQKKNKSHRESRLRIVFDSVRLPRGGTIAFTGVIEAIEVVDNERIEYESTPDCFGTPPEIACPQRLGNPIPSKGLSMARSISYDKTGEGITLVSTRNIDLDSETRFTVKVLSSGLKNPGNGVPERN